MKRFFLDTNVFVYASSDTVYRPGSVRLLQAIVDGAPGTTSVAVIEELWHLEMSGRTPVASRVVRDAYDLIRPALAVTDEILLAALESPPIAALGANDRVHVATCRANGIDVIVSGDRAFDGAASVRRVDPSDPTAVEELLADK